MGVQARMSVRFALPRPAMGMNQIRPFQQIPIAQDLGSWASANDFPTFENLTGIGEVFQHVQVVGCGNDGLRLVCPAHE